MNCVKCDGTLKTITLNDVEIDQCLKCSGIWFDFGELDKILEEKDIERLKNKIDNNQDYDQQKGQCPKCGGDGNMIPVTNLEKANLHIDTCTVCYGQWLDGGELEDLKNKGLLNSVSKFFKNIID